MKKVIILAFVVSAFAAQAAIAQNIWTNGATTKQVTAECKNQGGKIYRFDANKLICAESVTKKEIFLVEWRDPEQAVPGKNIDCNGEWKHFKICQK